MKRKTLLIYILFLHVAAAKAQFCNTEKGTVLYYKTFDNKSNGSKMDSTLVMDVKDENNKLIAMYKEYGDKPSKIEGDSLAIKFIFDRNHTTYVMYMDAREENERMKKKMFSYYPDERKADAEKDFQRSQKRMRAEGYFRIPLHANIKNGDEIPPCKYIHKIGITQLSMSLCDGRYEGFESVQTPASRFNCLKVSYVVKSKVMLVSETDRLTEWYAGGIGLVKNETTSQKGKSRSSSILVSIKRPK